MRLSVKQFIISVINLIVFSILMFYMLLNWNKAITYDGWAIEIAIVSLCLFIYQILIIKNTNCGLYSMILWFTVMDYIFIFGRIYLKALGYESQLGWNLFARYSSKDAYHAALYCLCYIQGIFTGMVHFRTSNIKNIKPLKSRQSNSREIGIVLFAVTFPSRIYCDIVQIITQRISGGYVAVVDINGVIGAVGQLLPISVIYIVASEKIKDSHAKFMYLFYCTYSIIVMMFSGDRRYAMIGIIAVTLCYLRKKNIKINLKMLLIFALVAFFGLSLLTTIRRIRETGAGSLETVMESLIISITEDNIFYELFNEFGLTFYTYMLAFKNIPSVIGYKFGASYIYAIISAIPGAYRFAYTTIMENNIYQSIYAIENQGLGGAFGQELYGNFGLFAPFVAIFAGYYIQKSMGNDDDNFEYRLVRYYSFFYLFLNLVRASLAEIIRVLLYYLIIVWILDRILRSYRIKYGGIDIETK